jgi:hypothetical protein
MHAAAAPPRAPAHSAADDACTLQEVHAAGESITPPPGDLAVAKWRPPVLISKDDTPPVVIPAHLLADSTAAPAAAPLHARQPPPDPVHEVLSRCVDAVCAEAGDAENSDQSHSTAGPAAHLIAADAPSSGGGGDEADAHVFETRHMADPAKVRASMAEAETAWAARVSELWTVGGFRPAEVDELLDTLAQFAWGEADPRLLGDANAQLQSAKDWYADVQVRAHCHRSGSVFVALTCA